MIKQKLLVFFILISFPLQCFSQSTQIEIENGKRILKACKRFGIQDHDLLSLIKNKADLEVRDPNEGGTSLFYASQKNRLSTVAILLKHGANVNTQDVFGYSPLMVSSRDGHIEVVKHLLNKAPDINYKDKFKKDDLIGTI